MRIFKTPYSVDWEENRTKEKLELQDKGIIAFMSEGDVKAEGWMTEVRTQEEKGKGVELSRTEKLERSVHLSGQCAGAIEDIKPARAIVEDMVAQAVEQLQAASTMIIAKL